LFIASVPLSFSFVERSPVSNSFVRARAKLASALSYLHKSNTNFKSIGTLVSTASNLIFRRIYFSFFFLHVSRSHASSPLYLTPDLFPPGAKHPYNMTLSDGSLTNVKNLSRFFGSPEIGDLRVFYDAIYSGIVFIRFEDLQISIFLAFFLFCLSCDVISSFISLFYCLLFKQFLISLI
jgi:hypothetical protein